MDIEIILEKSLRVKDTTYRICGESLIHQTKDNERLQILSITVKLIKDRQNIFDFFSHNIEYSMPLSHVKCKNYNLGKFPPEVIKIIKDFAGKLESLKSFI